MKTKPLTDFLRSVHRPGLVEARPSLSDAELLCSYVDQANDGAFGELVRRHGSMVFGVCRRMLGHHHDAEDAFQATFLVLARKARSIKHRERLAGWLYLVAGRLARALRASNARRLARERVVEDLPQTACQTIDRNPDVAILDEELTRLPQKYRMPVILCELKGRPRKAVAAELGIPEGTLSSRLATARHLLAERLRRRGVVVPGAGLAVWFSREASAGVPTGLTAATVRGIGAACGPALSLSPRVQALTEGVLKAMLLAKLKKLTFLVLVSIPFLGSGALLAVPGWYRAHSQHVARPSFSVSAPLLAASFAPVPEPKTDRRALVRSIATGHTKQITALAFSADGQTLASGSMDGTVVFWDVATGRKSFTWTHDGAVRSLAFSPDGQRLLIGHDGLTGDGKPVGVVRLVEDALPIWTINIPEATAPTVVFAPDGRTIACGTRATIQFLDAASGRERWRFVLPKANGLGLAFTPDGKMLAACHDSVITLFDSASGKKIAALNSPDRRLTCIAIAPSGRRLAVGGMDKTIVLWDLTGFQQSPTLKNHHAEIVALAFSPDGKWLLSSAGPGDHSIRFWNGVTNEPAGSLPGNGEVTSPLAFSPDGRLVVTVGRDFSLQLWSVARSRPKAD
jgi:RNA polymerase sigma factor (sigma-70 family)